MGASSGGPVAPSWWLGTWPTGSWFESDLCGLLHVAMMGSHCWSLRVFSVEFLFFFFGGPQKGTHTLH